MVFDDEPDQERWVYLRCTTPELVEGRDLRWWKRFCELARKRNKGNAPSRVIALETQKLLDDEAVRRSREPETPVEASEIEWFVQNLDNPLFDLALEDSGGRRRRSDVDTPRGGRGTAGRRRAGAASERAFHRRRPRGRGAAGSWERGRL